MLVGLPLAAPIGLSPLLILTLCGPERVLGGGGGGCKKGGPLEAGSGQGVAQPHAAREYPPVTALWPLCRSPPAPPSPAPAPLLSHGPGARPCKRVRA